MLGTNHRRANRLLVGCALGAAACTQPRALTGRHWQLQGSDSITIPAGRLDQAQLVFEDSAQAVTGKGFCNPLRGRYQLNTKARTLTFKGLQANWTACPDLVAETRFLELLRQIDRYERRGSVLVLYRGSIPLLTFSSRP